MLSPEADSLGGLRSQQPARVVVIGFGSPIRGDDAFGPLVADQLADQLESPAVEVLSRHILTAEMAATLRDATLVLFIDASVDGPVGEIRQQSIISRRDVGEAIAHSVDPPGLLAWTEALYGQAPPAILLTTRAVTLEYANYQLSPAVQATVRPLIERVREIVARELRVES